MGWGVTLTRETLGAAPVIAPLEFVGYMTWAMNTFQACALWMLGSTFLSEPYHTASARPGPPALIQGNTFTASPVAVEPSLTCSSGVQFRQPLAAEAALTKTCRWAGVVPGELSAQATNRLRAVSMDSTVNNVSGELGRLSAMWIRLSLFGPPTRVVGASRKVSFPLASGVPMLRSKP